MNVVWKARKRIWCGLPWTFTVYTLTDECILIDSGIFNTRQDDIRLYRILDITITRSFIQRIFGMGTIHLDTRDATMGEFNIKNIKNVQEVKQQLATLVEEARDKKRVGIREYVGDDCDGEL